LIITGRPLSPTPEAPRAIKRSPIVSGSRGRRNGSRRPDKDHAVLSITVSPDQVLGVRKAVVGLAHPSIDLLTVTPLPGGSRVRLTAYLASDVVDVLTQRILEFVTACNPGAECSRNPQDPQDAPRGKTSATEV
jgi:hypothetical protein